MMAMVQAYQKKQQRQWQRTATLGSFLVNTAPMSGLNRSVSPQELIPGAFPGESGRAMSKERFKKNYERHRERLRQEQNEG